MRDAITGCLLASLIASAACQNASPKQDSGAAGARLVNPTSEQIAALESEVTNHPENLRARLQLLHVYRSDEHVDTMIGRDRMIERRRVHILWVIEHHPEVSAPFGDIDLSATFGRLLDREGFAAARALWQKQLANPNLPPQALANAAEFFDHLDGVAIDLMRRARALDPTNELWTKRLAKLYARVLVAADNGFPSGENRRFANGIQAQLDRSQDFALFGAIGTAMAQGGPVSFAGLSYLDRAIAMNPESVELRRTRVLAHWARHRQRLKPFLNPVSPQSNASREAIASERLLDQLAYSVLLAEEAYRQGKLEDYRHETTAARASWNTAAMYANDVLTLAPKTPSHPLVSAALYRAHMVLAILALRSGDQGGGAAHLLSASRVPPSEELAYDPDPVGPTVVAYLLSYGDRATVIEFLGRAALLRLDKKTEMLADLATLRENGVPMTYMGLMPR